MYYIMSVGIGIILSAVLYIILKDETVHSRSLWIFLLTCFLLVDWIFFLTLLIFKHSGSLTEPLF